jgi:molybdenum cofactor biosynthesis protein B
LSSDHPRDQKVSTCFALLITSDTRTEKTDMTGKVARQMIEEDGHQVKIFSIVPNKEKYISDWIDDALKEEDIRVIVSSGGTGIGARDKTVDVARTRFEKELQGFGELFRCLSNEEIGLPGIWSRATAGVVSRKIMFCLPGSSSAVKMALEKIILPSVGHMLWELDRN